MIIKGLQKVTLLDYPGLVACTIFVFGCNFRCPYCHNRELVLADGKKGFSEQDVLTFLKKWRAWLDGVCITGGEPTLNKELPNFIAAVKKLGYKVKLDTNGSNPAMLEQLLRQGLVDYVAMDFKASLERYSQTVGVRVDIAKLKQSIELVKSAPDYEFRLTLVPGFIDEKQLLQIAAYLKAHNANKAFYLQQFQPLNCLDKSCEKIKPYSEEKMLEMLKKITPYFKRCALRSESY